MKDGGSPSVDVLMLAYNVAPFIEEAAEGVLSQRADFRVRLVIAEDGSTDDTRNVCARIASRYPERVLYMPGERNLGIARRTVQALASCTARYIAICDSDDRWTDTEKLAEQVGFLEMHPDHGLSYSDVNIIDRGGQRVIEDGYDALRADYADGRVFVKLLQGNFINNSTTVVRRDLLMALRPNACRDDLIGDHLRWLQVAMQSQVHFLPRRTTDYRRGGVTSRDARTRNAQVMQEALGELLRDHARTNTPVTREEQRILFRKILGVLVRPGTPLPIKGALLLLLFRYLPAMIMSVGKNQMA